MRNVGLKPASTLPYALLGLICRMARLCKKQTLARGVTGVVVLFLSVACEPGQASMPVARHPAGYALLSAEIRRLSEKVTALESQLQQEQRNAARARQETQVQRERIVTLEGQITAPGDELSVRPPPVNVAATMQAEAELRVAYRAMMRAIERLDISVEEKAALKASLRPTRSLDRQNPWSVAAFE
jgi:hypothetical protein